MRRTEKEIKDPAKIESIIRRSQVCRLALSRNNQPYIVPVCFGYSDGALYVHCAREGKKLDIIRENPNVCFEFDIDQEILTGQRPCDWGMRYRSVIGFGRVSIVDEMDAKRHGCEKIMDQYGKGPHAFSDAELEKILILRIDIRSMTGKQSGY